MFSVSRLGLGTVQFGINYGLTNDQGQVPKTEVAAILNRAETAGIRVLDTASQYGESEAVLGRALRPGNAFKEVSKTPNCPEDEITPAHLDKVEATLERSIELLGVSSLYGLLVHQAADLQKPGAASLARRLEEFRNDGRVDHIGVSVYDGGELDAALTVFQPDIVQLPYNILDQRLVSTGWLAELKRRGIEVHARSLFLQGLLLAEPVSLSDFFAPATDQLKAISSAGVEHGIGRLGMCLHAAFNRPELDILLVGVTKIAELEAILNLLPKLSGLTIDPDAFALDDESILNPALWPMA